MLRSLVIRQGLGLSFFIDKRRGRTQNNSRISLNPMTLENGCLNKPIGPGRANVCFVLCPLVVKVCKVGEGLFQGPRDVTASEHKRLTGSFSFIGHDPSCKLSVFNFNAHPVQSHLNRVQEAGRQPLKWLGANCDFRNCVLGLDHACDAFIS